MKKTVDSLKFPEVRAKKHRDKHWTWQVCSLSIPLRDEKLN